MKISTFFICTHVGAVLLGAIPVVIIQALNGGLIASGISLVASIGVASVVVGLMLRRTKQSLSSLQRAISAGDASHVVMSGIAEIDTAAAEIGDRLHRWAEAAVTTREQFREIEQLVTQLTRRGLSASSSRTQPGNQLREMLMSITGQADSELHQILTCTEDIERYTREISGGAEDQSEAVSKTTTYVEQMSANIDSVSHNADAAQKAAIATNESASSALQQVRELIDGMDRIRQHVEASESRLRSLGDHSQEIGSIVETISSISSRTDMLALNASIESVRAGEHGRGFAVVADEVRKLAEQAAQATREVAGLIESIQLETQESIALMAEEREEVEAEVRRVGAAGDALERINQISSDSASQVSEITNAAQLQLQLTRDVVLAVERISEVAKSSRTRAEEACWTTGTLTKLARQFNTVLDPLRPSRTGEFAGSRNARPLSTTMPVARPTTDNDRATNKMVDTVPTA
ncbi:MAG: methyl-accepting chemotaxis protein [Pirellulaceae bacterium]|nr:methyl-accepting chemotaxis protein [Pirellulaceae bacterium]